MALVTKTTWWGFGTVTGDTADNALKTFATETIYAETNSRVIKSAIVEVFMMDRCTLTGATVNIAVIGCNVGGSGATNITVSNVITHSAENAGHLFSADFTGEFTASFGAGASNTVVITAQMDMLTGTTLTTNNYCAVLKLTYEFDDAATNCIKTMIIPLESDPSVNGIPTTLGTMTSANQIPVLTGASGMIKDCATVTIRDYFFIIEGNENDNAYTTALNSNFRLNPDTAKTFVPGPVTRALGTDKWDRFVWSLKASLPSTIAAQTFEWDSDVLYTYMHLSVKLVVTYEFVRANATGTSVSVQLPFNFDCTGGTASTDKQVVRVPIDIQEPGNVTLQQSGVDVHWAYTTSAAFATVDYILVQVGAQTAEGYSDYIGASSIAGQQSVTRRFDSGAVGGLGADIAGRGQKYIDVGVYVAAAASTFVCHGIQGMIYLNYSTDAVPATGIDTANHTVWKNISNWWSILTANVYTEVAATAPAYIAETYYKLQQAALWSRIEINGAAIMPWHRLMGEVLAGEGVLGVADGWKLGGTLTLPAVVEVGVYFWGEDITDWFKTHPSDPTLYRMNIETARKWRLYSYRSNAWIQACATYHSIRYTGTRAITAYDGTGALPVKIHDYVTGELLYEVTAAAGGVYSYVVYDNTRQLISRTFESASGKSGASEPWTAT